MLDQLEKLPLNAVHYRQAVDHIFSPGLTTSKSWQACFAEILICTARLYLDYLLVTKGMHELEPLVSRSKARKSVSIDGVRERKLREELKRKLDSSSSWPGFIPQNSLSTLTGFNKLRDYTDTFTLHLPEIYEETFRIEACAKNFLASRSGVALAQLSVGLQHLGRNHASFVLQPLEWAADDGSWDES